LLQPPLSGQLPPWEAPQSVVRAARSLALRMECGAKARVGGGKPPYDFEKAQGVVVMHFPEMFIYR